MAEVRVLCGTARSAREAQVDALVRAQWRRAILLVPTRPFASCRTERLILEGAGPEGALPGAWGQPVTTFDDFVSALVRSLGLAGPVFDDLERRLVLEGVVERLAAAGKLGAVGEAHDTPGFITHLLRIITQLKQAAVDPRSFRERVARRTRPMPMDAVVVEAYEAYQAALMAAGAYDRVGLFWVADLEARTRRPPLLDNVALLGLDAFDDFTPSEFRLLRTLSQHLETLVFGLNCDLETPSRRDLFATPERTRQAIHKEFGACHEAFFPEPPPEHTAHHVAANLFWRDRPPAAEGLETRVELLPCAGPAQEVEAIGRRIKTLLLEGAAGDAIGVVFNDLGAVASLIRSVFREFAIPVRVAQAPTLGESAVCRFLLDLLESFADWRREAIADALVSPWLAEPSPGPDEAEALRALPAIARAAGIVAGRHEWRTRLEALRPLLASERSRNVDPDPAGDDGLPLRHVPCASHALDLALARLALIEKCEARFPREATFLAFIEAVEAIMEDLRIDEAIRTGGAPARTGQLTEQMRLFEEEALLAWRGLLNRLYAWHARETSATKIPRATFLAYLRRVAPTISIRVHERGVLCMDAAQARHLRFDYVFFGGLNEGDMPRPPATNAVYSGSDLEDLERVGIPLEGKLAHIRREMLLFHHVLATARQRLWLSWHTLSAAGRPEPASPFIQDVKELLGDPALPVGAEGAAPPAIEEIACRRDLCAAASLERGHRLRPVLGEEGAALFRRIAIERRRHTEAPLDAYDGVLDDPEILAHLREKYAGAQRLFSVAQLERYNACPFSFFCERVLGVAPQEAPTLEFDPRTRGTVLHESLERFHRRHLGRALADIAPEEAHEAMLEILASVFERRAREYIAAAPGLAAVEQRRIERMLERYLAIRRDADDAMWKPAHFEVAFGRQPRSSQDALSRSEPFALSLDDERILFSGRIDRLDRQGDAVRIIDYKSRISARKKDMEQGVALQLMLYVRAVEDFLLAGHPCIEALFLAVGKKDTLGAFKNADERTKIDKALCAGVRRAVDGIRAGAFPPTPYGEACKRCVAKATCRYEEGRILRKTGGRDGADAETA